MALLSCRIVDQIWMSRNPLYSHFFWLKCASPPPSLVSNCKAIVELSVAKVTSMWLWSVSWLTNCPVNLFIVHSLDFLSSLDISVTNFQKRLDKNSREWTKNCPVSETGKFSYGQSKKKRETLGWAKRLTKTTWTPLINNFLWANIFL